MSRLVITASPLRERWSITSATRRDWAAWPPAPDTLFSALVAAAASLGQACHPALCWLETLGNPAIEAEPEDLVPMTEGIEHFSPVADRTMWQAGARQARWHNSVGHPGPVAWSWTIDTHEHVEAIQRIVREVTYIGSSRGPVLATAHVTETQLPPGTLVPARDGKYRLRGIYPGRLDELEAAFQRGERPRPTQTVGYVRLGEERLASIWGPMIPLRRVRGQRLHVTQSVPITEAVRLTLTRHRPDGAPNVLTGHAADGAAPLAAGHMAIVPLARVDDRYADGDVLGVGLLLPATCDDPAFGTLIAGLQRWLTAGGQVDIGRNRLAMEVATDDPRRALAPDRLGGRARIWSSVTPVVCDRHPRRCLSLRDIVGAMCRDTGLPEPAAVEAGPHPFRAGGARSHEHALGGRTYLARRYITHLRVTWPRVVPGPVLLGTGRYFGLGAMLPLEEAA
jgi:CRISPR-associated protein Csb2